MRPASLQAPAGSPCAIPDLNKIAITPSTTSPTISVTGQVAAVPANAYVYVQSLPVGASIVVRAAADGSFTTPIEGPEASTIVVNCSLGNGTWQMGGAALFLTSPPAVTSKTSIPVGVAGPGIDPTTEYWVARGTANGWSFLATEPLTYEMDFTYYSSRVIATTNLASLTTDQSTNPQAGLIRLANDIGQPVQANFIPVLLTPTGLPIFDRAEVSSDAWRINSQLMSSSAAAGSFTARYRMTLNLPATMPAGTYVPAFNWQPNAVFGTMMGGAPPPQGQQRFQQGVTSRNFGPAVRVGDPTAARVPWVLLGNQLDNGNRGTTAREDVGKFEFAHKAVHNASRLVIPKTNTQGQPLSYRLEPYLPTISHQIGGPNRPVPPLVAFKFPDGQLEVQVRRPDGTIDNLGQAPFRAGRAQGPNEVAFGSTSINDIYELTTFDPGFQYTFGSYGHYEVTMRGWSRDAIGNVYQGGGTYDVWVAEALDLDLGTFAGTPFQVGDTMSPTVNVNPPVAADVSLTLRVLPNSSTANAVTRTLTGTANAFGYFHPGTSATRLILDTPGEYIVDALVSYTDAQGRLWMGAQRAASVIETPNVPFVAHGKRGITHNSLSTAWFRVKDIIQPGQNDEQGLGSTVLMPYHSGDVIWSADESDSGIFPFITIQDDMRRTALTTGLSDSQVTAGEIPVAMPAIRPDNIQAVQAPDRIKTWAYSYFAAARGGVTVRAMVASGEVQRAYWQFGDRYNDQLGNGPQGDRVDDAKLQYAGVVYRDILAGTNYYAIYGSMAAMIPPGTTVGQRVFPPFQGNGGGPSGGALISIAGEALDMFFTPVGVMPGSVLSVGDVASVSGVVWPTLPSKVDVVVTKPSGAQVTTTGRANKVGAYYKPGDDFAVTEAGIYTTQIVVTHDGRTSAGQVIAPYPTGGVLGAVGGAFRFYVASPESTTTPLTVAASATTFGGSQGVTLTVTPPAGVTTIDARVTVNMTGTVLDDHVLPFSGGAFTFTYATANYAAGFKNLDPDGSDTIDVTFYVRAIATGGSTVHLAKRVLLVAGRVWMVQ